MYFFTYCFLLQIFMFFILCCFVLYRIKVLYCIKFTYYYYYYSVYLNGSGEKVCFCSCSTTTVEFCFTINKPSKTK